MQNATATLEKQAVSYTVKYRLTTQLRNSNPRCLPSPHKDLQVNSSSIHNSPNLDPTQISINVPSICRIFIWNTTQHKKRQTTDTDWIKLKNMMLRKILDKRKLTIESRLVVSREQGYEKGLIKNGQEGTLEDDGNVLHLNCGGLYTITKTH